MITDPERRQLALLMVTTLPKYGTWATGFRGFDTPYGKVGFRQLSILWAIRYNLLPHNEVSPGRLAALHGVQPSVMTRALAKLEANGFILREVDPTDARRSRVDITRKGRHVSEYVEDLYIADMVDSMRDLDDRQIRELHAAVETLGRIVDDLEEKRKTRGNTASSDGTTDDPE